MRIHEHGVVKPVDGVVQGCAVNADLHPLAIGKRLVVQQRNLRTRHDALSELLLLAPLDDLGTGRVSKQDADAAPTCRSLSEQVDERDVLFGQKQGGVGEQVDLVLRRAEEIPPDRR